MDLNKYPLTILKGWEHLNIRLRLMLAENHALIECSMKDLAFEIKHRRSGFYFRISEPEQHVNNKKIIVFPCQYMPVEESDLTAFEGTIEIEAIINNFNNWIALLHQYDAIQINESDNFTQKFEEEFISAFKIVDEDAETNPFNLQQQLALFYLLEDIKTCLSANKDMYDVEPLIQEASHLQNSIQDLTKQSTIKKLSGLLAKIRKTGIGLIKEIWSEVKKQAIKKVIEGGFDEVQTIIQQLHNIH